VPTEQIAAQPATDVGICSRALVLLGEGPFTSFDEGSAVAVIAGQLYPGIYEEFLTSHPWPFCIYESVLDLRADEVPLTDHYKYVYQLPASLLQLISLEPNDLKYEIQKGKRLYSSTEPPLKSRYVAKVPENMVPPSAQMALVYRVAAEFAIPITSSKTRMELFFQLYQQQMKRARHIESRQRPSEPLYGSAGLVNGRGEGW